MKEIYFDEFKERSSKKNILKSEERKGNKYKKKPDDYLDQYYSLIEDDDYEVEGWSS